MVKYSVYSWSFHLWQGLFVTFDVYLPYLSDRSHFMGPPWTVSSVHPSYSGLRKNSFRSNQNNLNLLYEHVWKRLRFNIHLLGRQSYSASGEWLCAAFCYAPLLQSRRRLLLIQPGIWGVGDICGCVWTILQSNRSSITQVCRVVCQRRGTAELPDPGAALRRMLVKS